MSTLNKERAIAHIRLGAHESCFGSPARTSDLTCVGGGLFWMTCIYLHCCLLSLFGGEGSPPSLNYVFAWYGGLCRPWNGPLHVTGGRRREAIGAGSGNTAIFPSMAMHHGAFYWLGHTAKAGILNISFPIQFPFVRAFSGQFRGHQGFIPFCHYATGEKVRREAKGMDGWMDGWLPFGIQIGISKDSK